MLSKITHKSVQLVLFDTVEQNAKAFTRLKTKSSQQHIFKIVKTFIWDLLAASKCRWLSLVKVCLLRLIGVTLANHLSVSSHILYLKNTISTFLQA